MHYQISPSLNLLKVWRGPIAVDYLQRTVPESSRLSTRKRATQPRSLLPIYHKSDEPNNSGTFAWLNANKQSIALDATLEAERSIIHQICGLADVIIDGGLEQHKVANRLDVASLREINPRAIHCNCHGLARQVLTASTWDLMRFAQHCRDWLSISENRLLANAAIRV